MNIEQHYRVKDLMGLWNMSEATIRRLFRDQPVLRVGRCVTISESLAIAVAKRELEKFSEMARFSKLHDRKKKNDS